MSVDTAGLQGDRDNRALSQPLDELAESGSVGRELANGVGAIRGSFDTDPVAGVADVDAGGLAVLDEQGSDAGTFLALAT